MSSSAPRKRKTTSSKKPAPRKKPATRKKPSSSRKAPAAARSRKSGRRRRKGPFASSIEEIWFRGSTRVRAAGYWLREKAKPGPRKRRGASSSARIGKRERIAALCVAVVAALIALIIFVPLPLLQCSLSPAKQCPPPDQAIELVPSDTLLYAHLVRDPESEQLRFSRDIGTRIPDFSAVSEAVLSGLAEDSADGIQLGRDVLPWAEREVALAVLPGTAGDSEAVFIAGIGSGQRGGEDSAKSVLVQASGDQPTGSSEMDGTEIVTYRRGLALSRVGDFEVFGARGAVEQALEVAAGNRTALAPDVSPRNELPQQRFADIYVSRRGSEVLFGSGGGRLGQLGTFVDYEATRGFAIGVAAREGQVVVDIVSDLSKVRLEQNPNDLVGVPGFAPDLAEMAPSDSLAYLGTGEVGPALRSVVDTALGGDLAASFESLDKNLKREAGPDPLADLLPSLRGQAALILDPTQGPPDAILIVDEVDETRASEALAALQQPLAKTLADEKGAAARFEKTDHQGTAVYSLEGPSRLGLSYAIEDGRLIIASSKSGVLKIIDPKDGDLASSASWRSSVASLSDSPSALLFLDLQELTRLAELAGLAEDPLYAALSDDISNIDSLGVSVDAQPSRLDSRIVLDLR